MVVFIVSACLIANPAKCDNFSMAFDNTVKECDTFTLSLLETFSKENPGWAVVGYDCKHPSETES